MKIRELFTCDGDQSGQSQDQLQHHHHHRPLRDCATRSSDVVRLVGGSVQLDIQRPVPEFDELIWEFNRTNAVLKYYREFNKAKLFPAYKDRVEYNEGTYSLTLKNLQKTDSGLYEAKAANEKVTVVAEHTLSVLDPVEAPVLTLQPSNDTCNITLTCRGHDLSINSSCYKETCEEKEVTSHGGITLSLSVRGSSIICKHSNPASWKEDVLEMGELKRLCTDGGSSDVVRSVGDSVQLDIQRPVPEFEELTWVFNKTNTVVKYYIEWNKTNHYPGYKDRVQYNDRTYSLTLKNLQKTDSGLYEARTSGKQATVVAEYRLSVLDPVEAPVLTQLNNDTCNITLTCKGHDLSISSSCYNDTCEEKEVTSSGGVTLSLSVRGSSIICNHSNPVSWKDDVLEMGELKRLCADGVGVYSLPDVIKHFDWYIGALLGVLIALVGIVCFLSYIYKRRSTGTRRREDTVYAEVDSAATLPMTQEKPTTIYSVVGRMAQPPSNGQSSHEVSTSVGPSGVSTIYETISDKTQHTKPETIYAMVSKPKASDLDDSTSDTKTDQDSSGEKQTEHLRTYRRRPTRTLQERNRQSTIGPTDKDRPGLFRSRTDRAPQDLQTKTDQDSSGAEQTEHFRTYRQRPTRTLQERNRQSTSGPTDKDRPGLFRSGTDRALQDLQTKTDQDSSGAEQTEHLRIYRQRLTRTLQERNRQSTSGSTDKDRPGLFRSGTDRAPQDLQTKTDQDSSGAEQTEHLRTYRQRPNRTLQERNRQSTSGPTDKDRPGLFRSRTDRAPQDLQTEHLRTYRQRPTRTLQERNRQSTSGLTDKDRPGLFRRHGAPDSPVSSPEC
ncbi:hypothetical protein NFI96_018740 [Prochilodus magdalenae]|nr:hypothetical protein NFI96_018740 [Prochilodus magdalenae]